jgi:NADPH:quinone reductase-like Zn-dependent oxidoreductase
MNVYRLSGSQGSGSLRLFQESPPAARDDEVVVRVRASSVNFRDLGILAGHFGPYVKSDVVPLSDGAGEVVAVGPKVRRVAVGDRVAATYVDGWISGETLDIGFGRGGDSDGMLAESVVLSEQSVVKLPEHLSFEEGATLPCAAVTAWNALSVYGTLLPGQDVLIQGTGGVSLFALQLAKLFGARVIATTSTAEKAARLRQLGADEVVSYREQPAWEQVVLELTAGRGVDLVVEVGGAATMPKSILATKPGGRISVVGLMTGIPDSGFAGAFFGRNTRFHHIHCGSRDSFESMNRAIGYHRLKPVISHQFGFDEAPAAYAALADKQHIGKIVIQHG